MNLADVAEVHAKTQGLIEKWRLSGMPGEPGRFDLRAVGAWLRTRQRHNVNAGGGSDEKTDWDEELKKQKAMRAELEYRQLQGELVERDDVLRVMAEHIVTARTILEAIPSKVAMYAGQDQRAKAMDDAAKIVNLALRTLEAGKKLIEAGGDGKRR